MPLQKAEALFNFQPTADVELELKKGDIVLVRRTSVGEGWWEGELKGKRGLFPSSFVKMLPKSAGGSPIKEKLKAPLTPRTSKKAFMETLLTPATDTQDQVFDKEKSADLYVQGHSDISITAGPRWDCYPPTLTVVIKDLHTETRFSGVKHFTVFDVETKQLGTQVTRRYKNFLWLYDKMAELFPCLSLPPLPVKQFTGLEDGIEARRRGLENFLNRVANHPVLGCTKLLRDFLTEKDDKDWKIGRHLSNIKLPKSAKKLFNAPVYCTVKYPPFNVPINQLASIEKFSRFSRLIELNVQALKQSCSHLCHSSGEMMSSVNFLGKDIQRMARGIQPAARAQRRKLAAAATSHPNLTVPNGQPFHPPQRTPSDIEEEDSEGEMETNLQWNWRDDSKFNCMMRELYDLASGMRKLSSLHQTYQDSMERTVLDALTDYSGIIHTLPMLVRLHEDAMETYNASKEKDTKKEAEEVRQHCETLNNILLAEFDYFSNTMVEDFENVTLNLLKEQAEFHQQLANEWNSLYERYNSRRSSQLPQERVTSSGKSFWFDKSGSFTGSFPSSHASSHSSGTGEMDKDSTLVQSLPTNTSIPTFINVQRMDTKESDSWEKIDEDDLKSPFERAKTPVKTTIDNESSKPDEMDITGKESSCERQELYQSVIVHPLENEDDTQDESCSQNEEEVHSYANIEFVQAVGSAVVQPTITSIPGSPKKPKKPMPIRRKNASSEGETGASQDSSLTSSLEGSYSKESGSSPKIKAKVPQKPLPPAKPSRQAATPLSPDSSANQITQSPDIEKERALSSSMPMLDQLDDEEQSSSAGNSNDSVKSNTQVSKSITNLQSLTQVSANVPFLPHSSKSTSIVPSLPKNKPNLPSLPQERKPRSRTTLDSNPDKKQPILPPSFKRLPLKESKSTDPSQPNVSNSRRIALSTRGTVSTVVLHDPISHEPTLSEPAANVGRPRVHTVNTAKPQASPITPPPANSTAPRGRDELMRKLSLRRQRIEQQLGIHKPGSALSPLRPNIGNIAETPSERNSTISTSSSEVVVAYSTRRADESFSSLSSNGTVHSNESEVVMRKHTEDDNLSKYGIIEDTNSGSYVI